MVQAVLGLVLPHVGRLAVGVVERGDVLDDRPDLEVRLRDLYVPGLGGVYGSGVPGLIGGSFISDFMNAPAAAAIGCSITQPCGKATWRSSRGSHSRLWSCGKL